MTIENIIRDLEEFEQDYRKRARDKKITDLERIHNLGKAQGIAIALHWFKYLNEKTED